MRIPDVNVLIYAFNEAAPDHSRALSWLERAVAQPGLLGLPMVVVSGFIRIITNPKIMSAPASPAQALAFVESLCATGGAAVVAEPDGVWESFRQIVTQSEARAGLITDAYIASLAISLGAELATFDRDFARFKGLRYTNLLEQSDV